MKRILMIYHDLTLSFKLKLRQVSYRFNKIDMGMQIWKDAEERLEKLILKINEINMHEASTYFCYKNDLPVWIFFEFNQFKMRRKIYDYRNVDLYVLLQAILRCLGSTFSSWVSGKLPQENA